MKLHNECTPLLITLSQVFTTHNAQSTDQNVDIHLLVYSILVPYILVL